MKSVEILVKEVTDKIEECWQPLSSDEKWIVRLAVQGTISAASIPQEEKTEKSGVK